jgi:hypothetical protein
MLTAARRLWIRLRRPATRRRPRWKPARRPTSDRGHQPPRRDSLRLKVLADSRRTRRSRHHPPTPQRAGDRPVHTARRHATGAQLPGHPVPQQRAQAAADNPGTGGQQPSEPDDEHDQQQEHGHRRSLLKSPGLYLTASPHVSTSCRNFHTHRRLWSGPTTSVARSRGVIPSTGSAVPAMNNAGAVMVAATGWAMISQLRSRLRYQFSVFSFGGHRPHPQVASPPGGGRIWRPPTRLY